MSSNSQVQGLRILSQADWEVLYPATEYREIKKKQREEFTLHYLLAVGQNAGAIEKHIGSLPASQLNLPDRDKPYHLTSLMIAAMKGYLSLVRVLLDKIKEHPELLKKALDYQDEYGWTVLHHAAVSSEKTYALLKACGADGKKKTHAQGTPYNILCLVGRVQETTGKSVTFFRPESRDGLISFADMSQDEMEKLTGLAEWRDHPYIPQEHLKELWMQTMEPGGPQGDYYEHQYEKFRKNPPKLIVGKSDQLAALPCHPLELYVKEAAPEGAILCEYTGVKTNETNHHVESFADLFSKEITEKMAYKLFELDGRFVGNAGRFANMGIPVATVCTLQVEGFSRHFLVVTKLGGLKAGEPIRIIYGLSSHSLMLGHHDLLGKEELLQDYSGGLGALQLRYQQQKLLLVTAAEKKLEYSQKRFLELLEPLVLSYVRLQNPLKTPLEIPKAVLALHFSGKLTAQNLMEYANDLKDDMIKYWMSNHQFEHWIWRVLVLDIVEMDKKVTCQKAKEMVATWVMDNLEKKDVLSLMKGLYLFQERYENQEFSPKNGRAFLNKLEKALSGYEGIKDEKGFLGFDRYVRQYYKVLHGLVGGDITEIIEQSMLNNPDKENITDSLLLALAKIHEETRRL